MGHCTIRVVNRTALEAMAPKVLPYARPDWLMLDGILTSGRRVLFEGAQGALLDVDNGALP